MVDGRRGREDETRTFNMLPDEWKDGQQSPDAAGIVQSVLRSVLRARESGWGSVNLRCDRNTF